MPEATIFQGAFCLILYNLLQTVQQQVAAARSITELKQHLSKLLSVPIPKLWRKTTNQRHRKKTPTKKQNGAHTSVTKLLAAAASK
jgi:hypothetical protein